MAAAKTSEKFHLTTLRSAFGGIVWRSVPAFTFHRRDLLLPLRARKTSLARAPLDAWLLAATTENKKKLPARGGRTLRAQRATAGDATRLPFTTATYQHWKNAALGGNAAAASGYLPLF